MGMSGSRGVQVWMSVLQAGKSRLSYRTWLSASGDGRQSASALLSIAEMSRPTKRPTGFVSHVYVTSMRVF